MIAGRSKRRLKRHSNSDKYRCALGSNRAAHPAKRILDSAGVVPAFQEREDGDARFGLGPQRAPLHEFAFERGEEAFCHGIIEAIIGRPGRGHHSRHRLAVARTRCTATHRESPAMQLDRDPRHPAGTSRSLVDGPDRAAQLLSSRAWHDGNVHGLATRSTRWRTRPALGTAWPPDEGPDSSSRTRRPPRYRAGLPSEPGRDFSWYLALFAKRAVLAAKPPELLEIQTRQTVLTTALVAVRLTHPIADRRSAALELALQPSGRAARANRLHHPSPGTPARTLRVVLPSEHLPCTVSGRPPNRINSIRWVGLLSWRHRGGLRS